MTVTPPGAAEASPIRILIADDHEVVRIGLAALLDAEEGFSVVARAQSGDEAVRLAAAHECGDNPGRTTARKRRCRSSSIATAG